MTHICVGKLTIIGSDNGLSPGRRQAIIWTNAVISLIGPLGTNFSEILIEILRFSFKKMCFKVPSATWRPFCLGLNVLTFACLDAITRTIATWSHLHPTHIFISVDYDFLSRFRFFTSAKMWWLERVQHAVVACAHSSKGATAISIDIVA